MKHPISVSTKPAAGHKQALFMPAITAARRDPAMKLAYQRLIAHGKKPIVAVTAIMRRIIVIANARARDASNQSN